MGLDMYLSRKRRDTQEVEEVAYWRKANHIHQWFVENVQGGEDNCQEYRVSREQLQTLLETVKTVLQASVLVPGKVTNGYTIAMAGSKYVETPILEDGKRIADPSVAQALLPTQEGFFFGGTDYDEYYYADLEHTRDALTAALAQQDDSDFCYQSSW
jgi:hypothetical protein